MFKRNDLIWCDLICLCFAPGILAVRISKLATCTLASTELSQFVLCHTSKQALLGKTALKQTQPCHTAVWENETNRKKSIGRLKRLMKNQRSTWLPKRCILEVNHHSYPLVTKHSYWKWPFIVDPWTMVIFHSFRVDGHKTPGASPDIAPKTTTTTPD